jgi:hypothetical protein
VLPPTEAQVVEATEKVEVVEVMQPNIEAIKRNNDTIIEMVQKAANNAFNETMVPAAVPNDIRYGY